MSLVRDASHFNLDVVCISESRLETGEYSLVGEEDDGNFRLLASGNLQDASVGGVGILLSSKASAAVEAWGAFSSRIAWCRLAGSISVRRNSSKKRDLFVVSVYAPHNAHDDATKQIFYEELSACLSLARQKDVVLIAGDFNASLGPIQDCERDIGGRGSLRDVPRNDNGSRLVDFCDRNSFFVASTGFMHRRSHAVTFKSNGGGSSKQIDHVLIGRRFRHIITNVRSRWGTHTDSDHSLVVASIFVKLLRTRRPSGNKSQVASLDLRALSDAATRDSFRTKVDVVMPRSLEGTTDLEEKWAFLKNTLVSAAVETCPRKRKLKDILISEATLSLISLRRGSRGEARKRLNKQVRSSFRNDLNRWFGEKANIIQRSFEVGDSKSMYKNIRDITGASQKKSNGIVKDAEGNLVTDRQAILRCWVEHFGRQFAAPPPSHPPPLLSENIEVNDSPSISVDPPSDSEIRSAVDSLKQGKAAGPDDVFPEMLKSAPASWFSLFASLVREIWEEGRVPADWAKSICIPIHKKGSQIECSNYRGISLIQVAAKVLESILARRMNSFRESHIREQQAGFRRGRSCIDHIFVVRQVLELRKAYRVPTLACFLDIKGAFDSVDRSRLWDILAKAGIPVKIISLIKSMYENQSTVVRASGSLSDDFSPCTGVWQGAVLSPILFTWVIDRIINEALSCPLYTGIELGGNVFVNSLEYADDLAVFAESASDLQAFLDSLSIAAGRDGLVFAPHKCAVLHQDIAPENAIVLLAGVPVPVVDRFDYLGSVIEAGGKSDADVDRRICLAASMMRSLKKVWKSKNLSLRVKGRIYGSCVRSVLLYGSETWTLTTQLHKKISVFDNKCLRWLSGYKRNEFVRNSENQQRIFGDRYVGDVGKVILERQLRWLGHVSRMPNFRLPSQVLSSFACNGWRRLPGTSSLHWRQMMKEHTMSLCRDARGRISFSQNRERQFDYRPWLNFISMFAADRCLWRKLSHCIVVGESIDSVGDVALLRDTCSGLRACTGRRR